MTLHNVENARPHNTITTGTSTAFPGSKIGVDSSIRNSHAPREGKGREEGVYLWAALGAVGAADVLDVSAPVLVASAIPPLERLRQAAKHRHQRLGSNGEE